MNLNGRIKSERVHPQYVLNVSIDIPLKSKFSITHRSQEHSLTPSPNNLKKRYRLLVTPIDERPSHSKAISRSQMTTKPVSRRQADSVILKQNTHYKNKSQELRRWKVRPKIRFLSGIDEEEEIIKYTSHESEIPDIRSIRSMRIDSCTSELDIIEIRSFETLAQQKKERINYEYIKEKILMQASAKKIQRAWRTFRTRKLIKSYSMNIKIKPRLKDAVNCRSAAVGIKIHPNKVEQKDLVEKGEEQKQEYEMKNSKEQELKKVKKQSIKKWDDLADQIKAGKDINVVLEHSERRREELKTELRKIEKIQSKNYYNLIRQKQKKELDSKQLMNSVYNDKQSPISLLSQQRTSNERMEYFEAQILKLDNDISSQVSNQFCQSQKELSDDIQQQQMETMRLKKKLQLFSNHINNSEDQSQRILVPDEAAEAEDNALTYRDHSKEEFQNKSKKRATQGFQKKTNPRTQYAKLRRMLCQLDADGKQDLLEDLLEQFADELLIELSGTNTTIKAVRMLYEQLKEFKKPQGISTGLPSIKDYIENFANYVNERERENVIKQLSKPFGPPHHILLKHLRTNEEYDSFEDYVLKIQLFNDHWEHLNQLIYFDPKFQDEEEEAKRVYYLKQLTKVFFRAIFDAFNEALESQRVYGQIGQPSPWNSSCLNSPFFNVKTINLRDAFRNAYRKIISFSAVGCGTHFNDKRHLLTLEQVNELKEESLQKLLLMDCRDQQYSWWLHQDDLTRLKQDFYLFVENVIVLEVACQLNMIKFM